MKKVVIVGGGAAGFFAALACAEKNPNHQITILEKSQKLLSKVKVSGGGRCNVTHACFEPKQLVKFYPRGERQLLGPFTRFNPSNTIEWFAKRGVKLKAEADGRMFPVTDNSQTIIDCFLEEAGRKRIEIKLGAGVEKLQKQDERWMVTTKSETIVCDVVIITTGSSEQIWRMLKGLGMKTVEPVPSLFTFNINDQRLKDLPGVAVKNAMVTVRENAKLKTNGPMLITHWGLSGPAILKLSAWGARELADLHYRFSIKVNWTGAQTKENVLQLLQQLKQTSGRQQISNHPMFDVPIRLWKVLVNAEGLNNADLSKAKLNEIATLLTECSFIVNGKSIFKEEFVTAGGVDLNEVNFKTMQSKQLPGLFFAGEVLDIDAVTGGFNFQAAWTTGYIAGTSI
jgi:predicted Rossmann fold flavoprotein